MESSLSLTVIDAVAERENVDPVDLPPLFSAIDPDALDSLFRGDSGYVVFDYLGYQVTVEGGGDVRLKADPTRDPDTH